MSRHVTPIWSTAIRSQPLPRPCGAGFHLRLYSQSRIRSLSYLQDLSPRSSFSRPRAAPSLYQRDLKLEYRAQYHACSTQQTSRWPVTSYDGPSPTSLFRSTERQGLRIRRCFSDGRRPDTPKEEEEGHPTSERSKDRKTSIADAAKAAATERASHSYKQLLDRFPHLHRPTKEELLAVATGFWQRLGIRFKWYSIRSFRPFNPDEIGALFSWVVLGHVIWIIVGTTTFFSLAIFAVNTVFAQETLAGWIGNYLTKSSGVKVVFESAIVPKWKDGVITFRNVFVSRRPGQGKAQVSKGSSTTAAAAAAAAATAARARDTEQRPKEEDTNYTQFDVSIDTVNVTLSFTKWFNGKGPLRDVEVKGVRGVIDRTSVVHDPTVDPRSYKHTHNTGDFETDSFKLDDLLVTIYQPHGFRPFSVSVFSADLPRLRKQWLFYDFLSANNVSGSFDESLFTIHPRQSHSHISTDPTQGPQSWKKHSHIRLDGLAMDHLNRGVEGPFGWIYEGKVDIIADVMFPPDSDASIAKVVSDFYDRMEATVTKHAHLHSTHQHDSHIRNEEPDAQHTPTGTTPDGLNDNQFLVMDMTVHMQSVRAAVPIFNRDLSYVNNALIRPIVAYINSKRNFIPVTCRVVKALPEFDGSWTIYDSGLMLDLSKEMYDAFARDIVDRKARKRRLKKVGLWTIQLAAQALFIGLAGQLA